MPKKIMIIGTGSQARYVLDLLAQDPAGAVLGMADIEGEKQVGKTINGVPVICTAEQVPDRVSPSDCAIVIAYGDVKRKQTLAGYFQEKGFTFANAISRLAYISPTAVVGQGCVMNP